MKRRINRTEHYAGGASKQSMQQSEKQSCSPSLSLSSLVRRVWSFITLPSSPSAAVFSSSLQNAERASSEAAAGAASVGRSVGRSVVQPGLYSGAIVLLLARSREGRKNSSWSFLALSSPLFSLRTTDCDRSRPRPCVHVRSCPTVGQSVRPSA